jgi:predicted MFS family arabinose efflux permease
MLSTPIQLYKKAYSGLSRNSWYLCLVMFINRSGTMVIPFMSIYCNKELHFSVEQAGYIMGIFGAGSIAGAFTGGRITDKYGFYYMQFSALLLGGLLFFLLGLQTSFLSLAIVSFIQSFCNESFRPANSTAIAFYSNDENKTRSYSLNRLAVNLGWAFGGLLGGTLAAINYHLLFWVDGSTNVLAALLLLKLIPYSKVGNPAKKVAHAVRESAYKDGIYLTFIVLAILFASCFFQLFSMQSLFYKTQWHFSEQFIGMLMGVNGLLIVCFEMIIIHNLEGKRHPLQYISIGVVLVGAGFVLLNFLPAAYYASFIVVIFVTIGEIMAMPFMNSFWISRTNENNRGEYAALYTIAWSIAQIFGPVAGGVIAAHWGYNPLWFSVGIVSLVASVGFRLLYNSIAKRKTIVPIEETVF